MVFSTFRVYLSLPSIFCSRFDVFDSNTFTSVLFFRRPPEVSFIWLFLLAKSAKRQKPTTTGTICAFSFYKID